MNLELNPAEQSSTGDLGARGARKSAVGFINKVEGARVQGWAHDPAQDASQTVIEFLLDGKVIESTVTSQPRMFLVERGLPPNCGFSVALPLPPGTHTVSARIRKSKFELKNSPFQCTVPQPRGIPSLDEAATAVNGAAAQPAEASARGDKTVGHDDRMADVRPPEPAAEFFGGSSNIEAIFLSPSGAVFVVGWAAAVSNGISHLTLNTAAGKACFEGRRLGRSRRRDVEKALGDVSRNRHFGLFAIGACEPAAGEARGAGNVCTATLEFENGLSRSQQLETRSVDDAVLLETALNHFSALEFHGNNIVESFQVLDGGLGDAFIRLQTAYSRRITRSHTCTRFGTASAAVRASIIVCLYGRPEYLFLQNAAFGAAPEFEFIYVSNSPEIIETLHRTAAISARIYGLPQTIIGLPANAGFGPANNVAADYARSDRLLFVNPDVFPRSNNWANEFLTILEGKPAHQTALFGARLFYSDGSLMHGGMHFDADMGISVAEESVRYRPMLRVEHYGKGAPPDLASLCGSRSVPAVSGAFISIERNLFDSLDGFSADYLFGHYEDADLCLRARKKGVATYMHDIEFWHLEGKGSKRLPHHDGASLVNRWQFTRTWYDEVIGETGGRHESAGAARESPDPD